MHSHLEGIYEKHLGDFVSSERRDFLCGRQKKPQITSTVENSTPSLSVNVAEYAYFSSAKNRTFKEWVKSSHLPETKKQDVMAYLKGHSLEEIKLPATGWKEGSSTVTIGMGSNSYVLDFAGIEQRKIRINNKNISIPTDARVGDVNEKIKGALDDKQSRATYDLPSLLITQAQAAEEEIPTVYEATNNTRLGRTANNLTGAVTILMGTDFLSACARREASTYANCIFKSDSSAILADLGDDKLLEFTCNGNQISSYKYETHHTPTVRKVAMDYKNGKLSSITTTLSGDNYSCKYEVNEDLELLHVDGAGLPNKFCLDHSTSATDIRATKRPLEKGDRIKTLMGSGTSIRRALNCCKNECKNELQKVIAKSSSKTKSGAIGSSVERSGTK